MRQTTDTPADLLEREGDVEQLATVIAAAASGDGCVAAIEGAAGIGKTSLLAAGRRLAIAGGMQTLDARGAELERAFSFGVVLQLLDPVVRARQGDRPALWSGAARLARGVFDPEPSDPSAAPDPDWPTLYGLYWLIARVAERAPLLIAVDDLQWVDPPSLRLLAFLARRLDGLPIALVVATRTHVRGKHRALLDEIAAEFGVIVRPRPLSRCAVAELLSRRLSDADDALADACTRATAGNPFYVRALLDEFDAAAAPPCPARQA